jgi:hypothetical protein
MNKLIVKIIKNNEIVSSKAYKSLKAVQLDYPDYTYHSLRCIYLKCSGSPTKLHKHNLKLYETMRINDA